MKLIFSIFPIYSSILALTIASCGIDNGNHYGPDNKTFGQDKSQNQELTHPTPRPRVATPTPTPAQPTPTVSPTPPPTTELPPPSTGDALLSEESLAGYFDIKSLKRIVRGPGAEGTFSSDSIMDSALRGIFGKIVKNDSVEFLDVLIREEGEGRQVVLENAITGGGDRLAELQKTGETKSGMQKLHWVLGEHGNCPKTFICADRIEWHPVHGQLWTYCFKDMITDKAIVVPYAPNPNFGPESFAASIPNGAIESQPFIMTKHPGSVKCDQAHIITQDRQLIQWKVSIGNLNDSRQPNFYRKAKFEPLTPDTEIVVEYGRYSEDLGRRYQPKQAPFIDDISRFNSKVRYFLNSQEHALAKVILTVQSPISVPMSSDTTGVQVDYVQEFCFSRDVGKGEKSYNHCTGAK